MVWGLGNLTHTWEPQRASRLLLIEQCQATFCLSIGNWLSVVPRLIRLVCLGTARPLFHQQKRTSYSVSWDFSSFEAAGEQKNSTQSPRDQSAEFDNRRAEKSL